MLGKAITIFLLLTGVYLESTASYSPSQDAHIIKEYKEQQQKRLRAPVLNHAKIARRLVNQANWAAFGTISVNSAITSYPMVNVISVNDNNENGESTGHIQFLLTDLDFTGNDWQYTNKATLLFTDDELLKCSTQSWINNKTDPMEPTCARTMISGEVVKLNENSDNYLNDLLAFVYKHPAAKNWLKAHTFYLCELNITNIYVLDYYGGPQNVNISDYYKTSP